MLVGIPKEQKQGECRVAITPESVKRLIGAGIEVVIESTAGVGSGYSDQDYKQAGAVIANQEKVWEAELILKVKEPMPSEYHLFKENQVIWGFLHLAANPECVKVMVEKHVCAIASENIVIDGSFQLLKPVSEIAGRKALFTAVHYLEAQNGGSGILLSGTSVAKPGVVTILGGGVVAQNACDMALAIGASVNILEINDTQIENLKVKYDGKNVTIIKSTSKSIYDCCVAADAVISTVLIPGGNPPKLITKEIVAAMKEGSVIVDVSSDQGGTCETLTSATSHAQPTVIVDGVVHYAVPNMPASVPRTATNSIQGVIDLIIELYQTGIENINNTSTINSGIQVKDGKVVNQKLV
ncbi:alanine dehydrogenase [Mollicutes bacterium LVI A0078]|nr:alanine dehydrogenase [Mollicutes bacterium LVI A0075]WOO90220.1 alanine dehydrogenase [Mollicutes bacterium LVI A0078]